MKYKVGGGFTINLVRYREEHPTFCPSNPSSSVEGEMEYRVLLGLLSQASSKVFSHAFIFLRTSATPSGKYA